MIPHAGASQHISPVTYTRIGTSPLQTVPSCTIMLLSTLSGNFGPGTRENDRAGGSKAFTVHETSDIQGTVMVTRVGIRRNCANRLIFAWTPSYLRLRTGPERWPEAYVLWSSTVGQGLSFREVTPYRDHPLLVYVRNAPPRSLRFR